MAFLIAASLAFAVYVVLASLTSWLATRFTRRP